MDNDINSFIASLIKTPAALVQIRFAARIRPACEQAIKVDFPRLEIVTAAHSGIHDVLYIPAGAWCFPSQQPPGALLSIQFGKQQIEFRLQRQNGSTVNSKAPRRGPRVGSFLLQALNELQMRPQEQQTARCIVISLLSHCADLLGSQAKTSSRSQALFEAIQRYIDERFAEPLSRDSVAQAFYLSPNYLSHLFHKCGPMGFNEYLNHIRLERARMLLKEHDMKVKDIAHACGFIDSNYFCRLFRKNTERSPSEYRRQYHSQLMEKPPLPES